MCNKNKMCKTNVMKGRIVRFTERSAIHACWLHSWNIRLAIIATECPYTVVSNTFYVFTKN